MKKNTQNKIIQELIAKPLFSAAEARKAGIHPSRLSYYNKIHIIERVARGMYRGTNAHFDVDFQWEDLILTVKSIPQGVVSLISALALYELTDEIPSQFWIAIPHATTAPKRDNVRIIRMRDSNTGRTEFKIGNETITIFNIERTIIDAFRYLSKEIAIKALKQALKPNRKISIDIKKLQQYAKKFRVNLTPYLLTTLSY